MYLLENIFISILRIIISLLCLFIINNYIFLFSFQRHRIFKCIIFLLVLHIYIQLTYLIYNSHISPFFSYSPSTSFQLSHCFFLHNFTYFPIVRFPQNHCMPLFISTKPIPLISDPIYSSLSFAFLYMIRKDQRTRKTSAVYWDLMKNIISFKNIECRIFTHNKFLRITKILQ